MDFRRTVRIRAGVADAGPGRARSGCSSRRCDARTCAPARIVAALIAFAALASLWNFIRRTNFQVSRFIESVRFEDYSQRFSDPSGGGFDVLGETLDTALKTLQARHIAGSRPKRAISSAIVDDAPERPADHRRGRPGRDAEQGGAAAVRPPAAAPRRGSRRARAGACGCGRSCRRARARSRG